MKLTSTITQNGHLITGHPNKMDIFSTHILLLEENSSARNCSPSTRPSEDVLKSKRQVKNNLYQFDKKRCLRYVLICQLSGHVDDNKTYIALTYFPGLLLEKHIPRTSLKEQVSNHCFRHLAMDDIKVNRIL